jgi:hypothetical protein
VNSFSPVSPLNGSHLFAVKQPQEATLDSTFLLIASNVGAQKARAMKSGSGTFDVDDFISQLVTYMGGGKRVADENIERHLDGDDAVDTPLDWAKIGRKAMAKSRRVPAMGFMLGPLSIEQKKRVIAKRSKQEKSNEEARRPQELKEEDIQRSENETVKNVAQVSVLKPHVDVVLRLYLPSDRGTTVWRRPDKSIQIHYQPQRLRSIRREYILPVIPDPRWQSRARDFR